MKRIPSAAAFQGDFREAPSPPPRRLTPTSSPSARGGPGTSALLAALRSLLDCSACVLLAVVLLGLLVGCHEKRRQGRPGDQVVFHIKGVRLSAEIACDSLSRRQGLMHRTSLPENDGMLFLFPNRKRQGFWMRNTNIPLSIAFIDDDGTILQIEHMKPHDETSTVSMNSVRYALEMNRDWFSRNDIEVGDQLEDLEEKLRPFRVS